MVTRIITDHYDSRANVWYWVRILGCDQGQGWRIW